jgi:hypothetical protein
VSGHGKREAASRANAIVWRDRVIDDARSGEGLAAARARDISVDLIMRYLVDRGHVERTNDRDLIRPVRGDEMPLR